MSLLLPLLLFSAACRPSPPAGPAATSVTEVAVPETFPVPQPPRTPSAACESAAAEADLPLVEGVSTPVSAVAADLVTDSGSYADWRALLSGRDYGELVDFCLFDASQELDGLLRVGLVLDGELVMVVDGSADYFGSKFSSFQSIVPDAVTGPDAAPAPPSSQPGG